MDDSRSAVASRVQLPQGAQDVDSNKDSDEHGERVSKHLLGHLDDAQDEVEPGDVEGLLDSGPGEEDPDADADGEDEDPDANGEDVVESEVEHDLSAEKAARKKGKG